jgi:hypothetical protein
MQQATREHHQEDHPATPPTSLSREGRISPRMREQDADLLECMHYASSQVSHYSPDGTPLLRPQDRSLPMEDVPLILMPLASTSELLMKKEGRESSEFRSSSAIRTTSFSSERDMNSSRSSSLERISLVEASPAVSIRIQPSPGAISIHHHSDAPIHKSVRFPTTEASVPSLPSFPDEDLDITSSNVNETGHGMSPTSLRKRDRFRRLLSGEVWAVPGSEDEIKVAPSSEGDVETHDQHGGISCGVADVVAEEKEQEEVETTASPVTLAQEVATAKTEQDEGLAERRRKSEAIQFAQAVGEEMSINRDALRIIEDSENGEGDSDDDDQTIEPQEITITSDLDQAQELITASSHNHANYQKDLDAMSVTSSLKVTTGSALPNSKVQDLDLPKHVDVHSASTSHHNRRKSRPTWPFEHPTEVEDSLTVHLSGGVGEGTNFAYKGICANPPEITKHGIQRGNYAQLHRKAWLEVSDKYHRYGKNLRSYYRYWERLGFPTNQFFDWLDSKGEAAGEPLPNLEECPRSVLDSDTVLYITNTKVTDGYALDIVVDEDGRGRLIDVDGDPVVTGPDGWIFVLRDNVFYGAPKITSISGHSKQRFHHSSFFGGKAVASAGIIITDDEGYVTRLYPHSGHYRPGEAHMQRMLLFIHRKLVDLRTFEIDMQQLMHVSREKDDPKKKKVGGDDKTKDEKKMKKVDSLHLARAVDVACYLAHKADFIGKGIFNRIHKIRKADATSVTEALNLVDGGGYWKKRRALLRRIPISRTESSPW